MWLSKSLPGELGLAPLVRALPEICSHCHSHVLCADMVLQGLDTVKEHAAAWAAFVLETRDDWKLSPQLTAALQVLEESGVCWQGLSCQQSSSAVQIGW